MIKIISLKSRAIGQISKFIFKSGEYELDDYVVFETSREKGFGKVVSIDLVRNHEIPVDAQKAVFRKCNEEDWKVIKEIEELEKESLKSIREEIKKKHINMKIICVEYSFDKQKLYIFFSSEEKIDFKYLLNFLFKKLRVWIELKQIGLRESAQFFGGVGICGRNICCNSFLNSPRKININSVENQNLYVGGTKFCGICGRLMCCLDYEEKMYLKSIEKMPKIKDIVETPAGLGIVVGINVISENVRVSLVNDPTAHAIAFKVSELKQVKKEYVGKN